jgi:hypothetical protein
VVSRTVSSGMRKRYPPFPTSCIDRVRAVEAALDDTFTRPPGGVLWGCSVSSVP